jgi:hypothetical protein
MEAFVMKIRNSKSFRVALTLVLMLLAGGFLWAGVPALASDGITVAAGQNMNPIAANLELTTFRNISIHGRFSATDPDGDAVTFEVADVPQKGSVLAEKDGSFIYTPGENKKGRDSFSYFAIDANGNISNKATVTISIDKPSTKVNYADMADNSAHYAALVLAEKGVLIGEKLGGDYFFRPDSGVTRGEFLALCLKLSDAELLKDITRTGFSDDSIIPVWAKPYISTGLMTGIITGFKDDDGRLVFAPQEPITFCEAAVVLNNLLEITDVAAVVSMDQDQAACPAWSYQAEINLNACDIMPAMGADCGMNVTRADAAVMLVAAMELMKERDNSGSLLNWAK